LKKKIPKRKKKIEKGKEEKRENEPLEEDYDDVDEYVDGDTTEDEQQQQIFPLITGCHSSDVKIKTEFSDNIFPKNKKRKTSHVIIGISSDTILASPCDRENNIPLSTEYLPRALNFNATDGDDFSTEDNFLEINSINIPEFSDGENLSHHDEVSSLTIRDPLENDNHVTTNSWNFSESSWYDLSRYSVLTQGVCNGWWVE